MSTAVRDTLPTPTVAFHPAAKQPSVRFGPFRFDWADKVLSKDGHEIRLPPRAVAILAHLLERPGRIVAKQELLDAVWKDAFVSESSLTEAMGVLRQALGDTAADAAFIQTVHRRGYRFVATLQVDASRATSTLHGVPEGVPTTVPAPTSPPWRIRPIVIGATAVVAIGAVAVGWMATRSPEGGVVTRTTITLPEAVAPAPGLSAHTVAALAPDGRRIVYVAGSTGKYRLYLRALDRFDALPIPGTDGAHGAFFSPSGNQIGFFRAGRLFVTTLPDGEPLDIAAAGAGHGGWWHADDSIYVATGTTAGVVRVSAQGGQSTPVPTGHLNPASLRHPSITADGRTLLATLWQLNVRESEVVAVDLGTGSARTLARGVHPRAMTSTHVVYLRDGQLLSVPLHTAGEPLPMLSGVMTGVGGAGQYSLAGNGTLLYLPEAPSRMLRRFLRYRADGTDAALPFELRAFQNFATSPDGTRIATTIYDEGASDLWVGDVARGTLLRLTSEGGTIEPVWSHDGRDIYFASTRSGAYRIHRIAADGTGQPALVSPLTGVMPTAAGPGFLLAQRTTPNTGVDLVRINLDNPTEAVEWVSTPAGEWNARLSPDQQWVAYESGRTGRTEVFLRRLSGGPDVQLSTEGAGQPTWAPDGRAVFVNGRGTLLRVPVNDGRVGVPASVRTDRSILLARSAGPDLIALMAIEETRPLTTLHVVVNWVSEARALFHR
jgi:DNA-binding winged helix-turn-helix (wHTH) protein/Tol biopolymer transport system component